MIRHVVRSIRLIVILKIVAAAPAAAQPYIYTATVDGALRGD